MVGTGTSFVPNDALVGTRVTVAVTRGVVTLLKAPIFRDIPVLGHFVG